MHIHTNRNIYLSINCLYLGDVTAYFSMSSTVSGYSNHHLFGTVPDNCRNSVLLTEYWTGITFTIKESRCGLYPRTETQPLPGKEEGPVRAIPWTPREEDLAGPHAPHEDSLHPLTQTTSSNGWGPSMEQLDQSAKTRALSRSSPVATITVPPVTARCGEAAPALPSPPGRYQDHVCVDILEDKWSASCVTSGSSCSPRRVC